MITAIFNLLIFLFIWCTLGISGMIWLDNKKEYDHSIDTYIIGIIIGPFAWIFNLMGI